MSKEIKRITKHEGFMSVAHKVSERSTCLSRKIGAVIVKDGHIIATGYNGSPKGCIHCTDIGFCLRKKMGFPSGQGLEYCRAGHAESNAIDQCAKKNGGAEGSTLYTTTQPCTFCSIRIINSGIRKIIFLGDYPNELSMQLLKESGIEVMHFNDAVNREIEEEEIKSLKENERVAELFETCSIYKKVLKEDK